MRASLALSDHFSAAAALPISTWSKTFADLFGRPHAFDWSDVHHIIPGTMLTHALAQQDL